MQDSDQSLLQAALNFAQGIGVNPDQLTDAQIQVICDAFYKENHHVPQGPSLKEKLNLNGESLHDDTALNDFLSQQHPDLIQRLSGFYQAVR